MGEERGARHGTTLHLHSTKADDGVLHNVVLPLLQTILQPARELKEDFTIVLRSALGHPRAIIVHNVKVTKIGSEA